MSARPLIIQAAMPPVLVAAIKQAADRDSMSVSEYLRRACIDRLRWQGPGGYRAAAGRRDAGCSADRDLLRRLRAAQCAGRRGDFQ
jgi:hypothetical protein